LQNKIDRRLVRSKESGRQAVRWWMVFGVEMGRNVRRRGRIKMIFVEEQCFQFGMKELWRDRKR